MRILLISEEPVYKFLMKLLRGEMSHPATNHPILMVIIPDAGIFNGTFTTAG